jgi:uncharacterized damage-inducible protein DinB
MITSLQHILLRELRAVRREILAYDDEADLWKTPPGISNSAGTLALHLAGNLRAFIGAHFGNTGYVRNRDAEFALRGVPRSEIIQELDEAMRDVQVGLAAVTEAQFDKPYRTEWLGTVTVRDFMMHLAVHLGYHLGQIDYHRRLVTGSTKTVAAIAIPELATASGGDD